ncbi:MAG: DinB family protein [Ignavibacteria bacterium]|nr:DinB family protein [Ignavibacteria bacterium]
MELINHYKRLFDYDFWANTRVLEVIEKNNHGNTKVELLFSHILNSQQVWLHRINSKSHSIDPWEIIEPAYFRDYMNNVHTGWKYYLSGLKPKGLNVVISYENTSGDKFKNKLYDIMSHVLNHSTYHRAQISSIIKSSGYTPAITDYIAFARLNPAQSDS